MTTRGIAPSARRAAGSPLAAPLATGAAVLAATVAVAAVRPGTTVLPPCPLHALTGLWCPLCGGTRAVRALAHGDVAVAAGLNVLVVVGVPVAVLLWVRWLVRRRHDSGARMVDPPPWLLAVSAAVLVGFAVLRNLPAGAWLAP